MQVVGEPARGEGGGVHPVDRRVQSDLDRQVLGRTARQRGPRIEPASQPVGHDGVGSEPGGDVARVERAEGPESVHTQSPEQPDELGTVDLRVPVELGHAERGQELAGSAGWDDHPPAGGENGGEEPVGDADLAFHPGTDGDLVEEPLGGGELAAEVGGRSPHGEHQEARSHHFHLRRELLDRGDHRLERPSVPVGVVVEHDQTGAARLGLPPAQAPTHPVPPGERRAGDHPSRGDDRRGTVGRHSGRAGGRGDRPVG